MTVFPIFLKVGAVSRRRLTIYNGAQAPNRQQELAPTENIEIRVHQGRRLGHA